MTLRRTALGLVLACLSLAGLYALHRQRGGPPGPRSTLVLRLPAGLALDPTRFRFEPSGSVIEARLTRDDRLVLATDRRALRVQHPALCTSELAPAKAGTLREHTARALLDFGPRHRVQVGYDAALTLQVVPGCTEARDARVAWKQIEGPPLRAFKATDSGRSLSFRTLPLSHFFPDPLPHGLVPIAPRTQGRYVLLATAHVAGREPLTQRIVVTSMPRATGLTSLAVSQRVLLGGVGFTLLSAPRGSKARLEARDGVTSFFPDAAGRYLLTDDAGERLELQALTHVRTPLDCGRAECHAAQAEAARDTAMSHALEHAFASRDPAAREAAQCAIDCHAVGEPGLDDGGFVDVQHALGFSALADTPRAEWPPALRRLGAVGCTSCHGPGAIPPETGRARSLRSDVCATCHDAPPRYTHVAEWRGSRMAHADRDETARTSRACARCHTTGGFLDAIGVRPRQDLSRDPDGRSVGIACAACHAPHAPHLPKALVRRTGAPASLPPDPRLEAVPSALCAQCHAPIADESEPSASSAALWLGKLSFPSALGGGVLEGPAPHADTAKGCMTCHGAQGADTTQHAFQVDPAVCVTCHEPKPTQGAALYAEAKRLLHALDRACGVAPREDGTRHALPRGPCRAKAQLARARYALSLVVEDPAAHVHNPDFARRILDEAMRALGMEGAATPRTAP